MQLGECAWLAEHVAVSPLTVWPTGHPHMGLGTGVSPCVLMTPLPLLKLTTTFLKNDTVNL